MISVVEKSKRKAILILGMHRSGTSALTRVINILGATLPDNLLPAVPDNEPGYWESADFLELNNALLEAAATAWFDDAPIDDDWFASKDARALRFRGAKLLERDFSGAELFVLKDPRMCRLLPFWNSILEDFGAEVLCLHILRHPWEVFQSLVARARSDETRGGAINAREKSDLLWLRYVLEAERQTRGRLRSFMTYDELISDWRASLHRIIAETEVRFPRSLDEAAPKVARFLLRRQRHQHIGDEPTTGPGTGLAEEVYRHIDAKIANDSPLDCERLDQLRFSLNTVESRYAPLRSTSRRFRHRPNHWDSEVLQKVAIAAYPAVKSLPRVLYLSGMRSTLPTHLYRVKNRVEALKDAGFEASWMPMSKVHQISLQDHDIVVIFRSVWNGMFRTIRDRCTTTRVALGFDIDDLIFEPEVMTGDFHLRGRTEAQNRVWLASAVGFREALARSDFAVVSTEPLADAVRTLGTPAYVLPNGLSSLMLAQAELAKVRRCEKRSAANGHVRVGYASGSPSHQRDFGVLAPTLTAVLDEYSELTLTVVGHLDLEEYLALDSHRDRIEARVEVPHGELFNEYTRFDINVAPLEHDKRFCQCKSELKYFEAGAVEVPTIAAASPPYLSAIKEGETGFCAASPEEWRHHLELLIENADERSRLGRNARLHVLAAYGPEAQREATRRAFLRIAQHVSTPRSMPKKARRIGLQNLEIVIPHYLHVRPTVATLNAFFRHYPDLRLTLVDNSGGKCPAAETVLPHLGNFSYRIRILTNPATEHGPYSDLSHGAGIDLAVRQCEHAYLLTMESDTIVLGRGCIEYALSLMDLGYDWAGVGQKPVGETFASFSPCFAIFRTKLLKRYDLSFRRRPRVEKPDPDDLLIRHHMMAVDRVRKRCPLEYPEGKPPDTYRASPEEIIARELDHLSYFDTGEWVHHVLAQKGYKGHLFACPDSVCHVWGSRDESLFIENFHDKLPHLELDDLLPPPLTTQVRPLDRECLNLVQGDLTTPASHWVWAAGEPGRLAARDGRLEVKVNIAGDGKVYLVMGEGSFDKPPPEDLEAEISGGMPFRLACTWHSSCSLSATMWLIEYGDGVRIQHHNHSLINGPNSFAFVTSPSTNRFRVLFRFTGTGQARISSLALLGAA